MTASEWLDCDDPERLLAVVAGSACPGALRRVACLCCRRIFDNYPSMFHEVSGYPGALVSPAAWQAQTLVTAVAASEACGDGEPIIERFHTERVSAAATSSYQTWQWANYRLGDTASGADYEDAFLKWKSADAVAACCADDVRGTIASCLRSAAEAIGFRWDEAERVTAVAVERKAQAAVIRSVIRVL